MTVATSKATITLVGSYPPPHGGQSVHIQNLSTYLESQGIGVHAINTGANKDLFGFRLISVRSSHELFSALLRSPTPTLFHVHVSSISDFGKLLPVALAAALKRSQWMLTIHSGGTGADIVAASVIRKFVWRLLLRSAARIVCVSSAIRDAMSTLIRTNRLTLVPPHSHSVRSTAPSGSISKFIREHTPTICCVGLFDPVYGFEDAIRALAKVRQHYPDAGLLLIGNTAGSSTYLTLIGNLHLDEHVVLCGNLEHDQCVGVLRASTLFLRPTKYDGDSLSVREALASGVPVLASAIEFRPAGVTLYSLNCPGDLETKLVSSLAETRSLPLPPVPDTDNLSHITQLYSDILCGSSKPLRCRN